MRDDFIKCKHGKPGQLLHFLLMAVCMLGLFVIVEYVAFGQIRVRTGGGPARGVRYGAGGSVRYGQSYAVGAGSRLLPSQERYVRSARGLLPSQERYRRATSGMLPSAGRYGSMTSGSGMGTIRYGGSPARPSVPMQPRMPTAITAAVPRPYTASISPKIYAPTGAYSAQGSIRYGAAKPFSPKLPLQPSRVGGKVSPYAPETVLASRTTTNLNIPKLAYPSGSIRYGKTPTIAVTAAAGLP
jgi:hypothetical protein